MASIHKENGGISLEGMMKYANPLSTGSYGGTEEDISNILSANREKYQQEQYDLHGSLGPNPAYDEEGNIIPITGYPPDIAFSPLLSIKGLFSILKGLKGAPDKIANALTGGSQGLIAELRHPGAALRGMKLQAERQYLNKLKWPIEEAIAPVKKYLQTMPTPGILGKGRQARRLAGKDIGGKGGFKRFLHTMDAPKEMDNPKVYAAFQDIVKGRMKEASIGRIPKSYAKKHPKTLGYAGTQLTNPYVHLKIGRPDLFRRGDAVHEFTHIGQMPKWNPEKFAKSTSKLSKKETSFLENAIFGNPSEVEFSGTNILLDRGAPGWMAKYAEKMNPLMKKGHKIPLDEFSRGGSGATKQDFDKYMIRPHEISANIASIRDLDKMIDAPINLSGYVMRGLKNAMQSDLKRQSPYITKKGIKYAKDKLWGAGGGGLLGYTTYEDE